MSVKTTSNVNDIKSDVSRDVELFLRFLIQDVENRARPITPKREGPLRQGTVKTVNSFGDVTRGTIKWIKEYAAAQEVGMVNGRPIRNYTTPGTGKNYALRASQLAVINAASVMRKAGLIR